MKPKAFERGMYYPMLAEVAEEVRYRLVPIEVKCCLCCGEEYERGSNCPKCGEPFDGDRMRRKMAMRLTWCGLDASEAARVEGRLPLYLPDGRVHCNFSLTRWVPKPLEKLSVHEILGLRLPEVPTCPSCNRQLVGVDPAADKKAGDVRKECPHCSAALTEPLKKRDFACDNYFTISQQTINLHRYCPGGHELARPADQTNHLQAALHYDRLRQHPCPSCGIVFPSIPWCPCCREEGVLINRRLLGPRLTIMWTYNTVGGVSLDDPLRAAGLPPDFRLDAQP